MHSRGIEELGDLRISRSSQSGKTYVDGQTVPQLEEPRFVIVAFKTNKKNSMKDNSHTLITEKLTNYTLTQSVTLAMILNCISTRIDFHYFMTCTTSFKSQIIYTPTVCADAKNVQRLWYNGDY